MGAPAGWGPYGGRAARSRERGSILVLFALLLPLFLVCCAIAIDVGYWWVNAKKAQIAADACALAAAQELPTHLCRRAELPDRGRPGRLRPHPPSRPVSTGRRSCPAQHPCAITLRRRPEHGGGDRPAPGGHVLREHRRGRVGRARAPCGRRADGGRLPSSRSSQAARTATAQGLHFDGDSINITGHVHSNGEYSVNRQPPRIIGPPRAARSRGRTACHTEPAGPTGVERRRAIQFGAGATGCRETARRFSGRTGGTRRTSAGTRRRGPEPIGARSRARTSRSTSTQLKITAGIPSTSDRPTHPGWTIIPTGTYCGTKSFMVGGNNHQRPDHACFRRSSRSTATAQNYTPHVGEMLFFTVPNSTRSPTTTPRTPSVSSARPNLPPYPPCSPTPALLTELNGESYTLGRDHLQPVRKGVDQQQDQLSREHRSWSGRSTVSRSTSTATASTWSAPRTSSRTSARALVE